MNFKPVPAVMSVTSEYKIMDTILALLIFFGLTSRNHCFPLVQDISSSEDILN